MMDVTPQKLKEEMDKGVPMTVVDLQEAPKYEHSHVPGAVNIPLETFDAEHGEVLKDKAGVVVVYGEFDELGKGSEGAQKLEAAGYERVGRLVGGLMGWKDAGFPTDGGSES